MTKEFNQFWCFTSEKAVPLYALSLKGFGKLSIEELREKGFAPLRIVRDEFDPDCQTLRRDSSVVEEDGIAILREHAVPLSDEEIAKNLEIVYQSTVAKILKGADDAADAYMRQFSDIERATWDKQEAEVTAWMNDQTAPTPMMDSLANSRNISREEMLEKASAKVALFKTMAAALIGKQQWYEDSAKAVYMNPEMTAETKIHLLKAIEPQYA